MGWKSSLDKYLTSPPDDGISDYFDLVTEAFSEEFFDENEEWILNEKQSEDWIIMCWEKGHEPLKTAKIIERAKKIILNKSEV